MPAKYMHSFTPRKYGKKADQVFAWSNDPNEDNDLLTYVGALIGDPQFWEMRNGSINRSGAQPVLSWENWYFSGGTWQFGSARTFNLSTGSAIYLVEQQNISVFDTVGYWDSDVEGRPFDLNDLLA